MTATVPARNQTRDFKSMKCGVGVYNGSCWVNFTVTYNSHDTQIKLHNVFLAHCTRIYYVPLGMCYLNFFLHGVCLIKHKDI